MTQTEHPDTDLPSLNHLRAATSPPGPKPLSVGILVGPGFIPMDMVGVQTVFGLMPGARIHLIWNHANWSKASRRGGRCRQWTSQAAPTRSTSSRFRCFRLSSWTTGR